MFAAGIPLLAAGLSSAFSYFGQSEANEANRDIASRSNAANAQIAHDQMLFQERMSNSAYQRSRIDLEKAGLNPILAATQGGASTPSGAGIASNPGAPMQNKFSGIASALDMLRTKAEIENLNAQNKKIIQDTHTSKAQEQNVNSATNLSKVNTDLAKYQIPSAKGNAEIDASAFGTFTRYLNRTVNAASSALSLANSASGPVKSLARGIHNTYRSINPKPRRWGIS